ncbi:hypothetical protein [Actinophytocola sp.]|uniref:hypothetical protein n=1 Tax=Actinophytocola sp. TaxID=1872138 RepID=UPI00389B0B31
MKRMFLLLLTALLLAGCGSSRAELEPVTESEAYDRVEAYIQRAAAALPAGAHLEAAAQPSSVVCKGQPKGRVTVVSTYFVRGVAVDDKYFDTLLHWWEAHDFKLLDDLRPERHYLWVQSTTDGFRMSLRDNDHDELLLGAESPCLAAE